MIIKTICARAYLIAPVVFSAISLLPLSGRADLISNGGFESGLAGWTTVNQSGSEGTFQLQAGTVSPVNGDPVPPPPGGTAAAMTDALGPGAHAVYQSITLNALVPTTILEFDLFAGNRSDAFRAPNTLDFSTPSLNQQARVDILRSGADPFSVDPNDVLQRLFQTLPGDPLVSGYTHYSVDITTVLNSHLNQPLVLRFAETDNVAPFQFGVDNVLTATGGTSNVPDEASTSMLVLVVVGTCWAGSRRTAVLSRQSLNHR